MRCEKAQEWMEEAGEAALSGTARRHFEVCAACQSYAQDANELSAGLRLLAQELGPSPSWGFTARVLRQLGEIPARRLAASQLFENAGRRVVFATLLLIATLFLAMILPSSGPLRQRQQLDAFWPSTQVATGYYPASVEDFPPVPAAVGVGIREAVFHR